MLPKLNFENYTLQFLFLPLIGVSNAHGLSPQLPSCQVSIKQSICYSNSLIFSSWYGSEEGMVGADRNVVVPNFHHCKYQNGWLKYDHRIMYKKYTTSLPPMGCEVVERHLEMAQPTTTTKNMGISLI